MYILAYSGDSRSKSLEYDKIYMGLVTKLSRYSQIFTETPTISSKDKSSFNMVFYPKVEDMEVP